RRALRETSAGFGERARGPDLVPGLGQRVLQPPKRRRVVLDQNDRDGLRLGRIAHWVHLKAPAAAPATPAIVTPRRLFATPMFMGRDFTRFGGSASDGKGL